MKHQQQIAWGIAILALTGLKGAAQAVTFSDQDFNDSDWPAEIIFNESGTSAMFEAKQDPNRGNPGAFRRIKHEGDTRSAAVEIHVAHLRGDAVYDPSESGRITSIAHSYDLKNLESRTVWDSTYYLLIFQNDTYYRSPRDRISRLDWTSFGRSGLEPRDFTRIAGDGPRRPNFSDSAAPLQFGFASVSRFPGSGGDVSPGLGGDGDDSRNSGIDNWSVTIVPEGVPTCEILPRNTYLPTHVFENHLSNPARHLPHPARVAVTLNGAPPSQSTAISLLATKPAFLDGSGNPTLTNLTLQTDTNGQAAFEFVPPSAEAFDQTDFEAAGSLDGASFSCRGSVVSGLGALTILLRAAHLPRSIAPLRRLWNDVLAGAAEGRASESESSNETVRRLLGDAELRGQLIENLKKYPPLLQGIAIARAVASHEGALDRVAAVLDRFGAYAGPELQGTIRELRSYLGDRELLASFVSPPEQRRLEKPATGRERARAAHKKLPLTFEAHRGQAAQTVDYLARGLGYRLYLTSHEAVLLTAPVSESKVPSTTEVRMQLVGALPSPKVTGLDAQPGRSHYLYGNDPGAWRTGIPHYAKVKYEEVFPGVDLVYYGKQRQLAYDFIIAAGANPDQIQLTFQGVDALRRDERGNLLVESGGQQFEFQRPYIYQVVDGVKRQIQGGFKVSSGNLVGFRVNPYDNSRPLVIDPVLSYSTYVGGTDFDAGSGIAVGPDGSPYVAGSTGSANFPTESPLQPTLIGGGLFHSDGFVLKLNPAGTALVYATYFGGSEDDIAAGIAVDSQGNAYVTGSTRSPDFPVIEAAQPALTSTPAGRAPSPLMPNPATKVARQRLAGTEARSFWGWNQIYTMVTEKPGPDPFQTLPPKPDGKAWKRKGIKRYSLTLDKWWALVTQPPSGTRSFWEWNHYYQRMTGRHSPDPYQLLSAKADGRAWTRKEVNNNQLTADQWWALASQPSHSGGGQAANIGVGSAFIAKLNPQGSGWVYSTYLGGSGNDQGADIAVDAEGNAYVAGVTTSTDFPVKNALQPAHGGGTQPFDPLDAFVAKLNSAGSEVLFASYLGGSEDDLARGIALDSQGNAYVTGATLSANFPVTVDVFQDELAGVYDAFVSKLQSDGAAMLYSTLLGGESTDYGFGIAVDSEDNAYVTGITGSTGFPTLNAMKEELSGDGLLGFDAFVNKLNSQGSELAYSTYLGGTGVDLGHAIAVDLDGNAYVAGETDSDDFPAIGAFQPANNGMSDGFVVELDAEGSALDYATYLGGSDQDTIVSLALDDAGDVHVTGLSFSTNSPVTAGSLQTSSRGLADALVAKITPGSPPPVVTSVSAASFDGGFGLASESIASGFGEGLAGETAVATSLPLPTVLAGTSVRVTDSTGGCRLASLFFVSPGQINYLMPEGTAAGLAKVSVEISSQEVASGNVQINPVAPALFSADASGQGPAAASFLRVDSDGFRSQALTFDADTRASIPIDLGAQDDQVFLLLFGTGIRGFTSEVTAAVGGESVPVLGAQPQGQFVGLDQVNVGPLPPTLSGRGEVDVSLTVDGLPANVVTVNVQ